MDKSYELFCLADPIFYDSPTREQGHADLALAARPLPSGWMRTELGDWLMNHPDRVSLPPQGWKIHASATLENAEEILAAVWDYCVPKNIPFKFIRSIDFLFLRNAKYADRGSSGKFVTIYPKDEAQAEVTLTQLGAILEGQSGPYILSDLRWGDGPLYVRYGGFAEMNCIGAHGELVPAIIDASGELVPDLRGPKFLVPPWVALPDFLAPQLAARNATTIDEMPYRIESVLHFSNGGGIYKGVDPRSGDAVVLKEARPHAGLSVDRADAVARLGRERDILQRLAGLDFVPAVRDYFVLSEHHFLVEDFVEGDPLSSVLVERYPLTWQETDDKTASDYASWVLDICDRVEQAVAALHERGIVIGDLHPSNVLVRPDGRIALVDLEIAAHVSEDRRQTLADPGFMAPRSVTGFDIDRYALACLRFFLFMPLTSLISLAPGKAGQFADEIRKVFPVPDEFHAEAARVIKDADARSQRSSAPILGPPPALDPDGPGWERMRDSMVQGILSSATPQRDDRLFPGDVAQFATGGGLNLAHGAAGVLYALATTGAGRYPECEEWLVRRATKPETGTRIGLYDGLHGVAYVLDRLGRRSDALNVLDICVREIDGRWERLGLELFGGLAGIGLSLSYFANATGDGSMRDAAQQVATAIADRLPAEDDVPDVSGGEHPYAGLVRGGAGVALMFIRMYEETREAEFLDLAAVALRQDLRRCLVREDGSLEVNEGWRSMPYLSDGSVGIGMVLDDYLLHREDERFTQAAAQIRRAAEAQFYIEPGLFYGRAGMILYLSHKHPAGTAAVRDAIVAAQARRLEWHAFTYRGHLAFPGEQLLRLSMDLASGTAGVMLALGAALHDEPVHLPFLAPRSSDMTMRDDDLVLSPGRG